MVQPKALASLSSTLLARKGTARPAMRPQGFGGFGAMPAPADDLGWNDMGEPAPAEAPALPVPVPPVPMPPVSVTPVPVPPVPATPVPVPPVLVQREALAGEFAPVAEALRPVSVATATRIQRETRARHKRDAKSAFTLRLDADRHLRLRLASALQNRSAQQLVTEALDAFLDNLPEVASLIEQLPAIKTKGISR